MIQTSHRMWEAQGPSSRRFSLGGRTGGHRGLRGLRGWGRAWDLAFHGQPCPLWLHVWDVASHGGQVERQKEKPGRYPDNRSRCSSSLLSILQGWGRLKHPPFHSRACPASQGTSEAGPGGQGRSSLASVWRSTSAFPTPAAVTLLTWYLHANLGGHPPPPRIHCEVRERVQRHSGRQVKAPAHSPPGSGVPPSRACLSRTVRFVTRDTHSWAFREITTVSLSWGQRRDVCKETLLSEKLNHPARQTEGRALARLLSQAPPKSQGPTAGHRGRLSGDTPRGSLRLDT